MKQLCLGAVVAASLTLPAFGQSTLREQLVGAWALVSCNNAPWCANPNGIHILDASGHFATINAPRDRPAVNISDPKSLTDVRNRTTPEQYKAIATAFQANFGTWQVDEADKTITYHFDGSLFPGDPVSPNNLTGGKVPVSVSGDELRVGASVWRRLKK
jgi:hypothetical protein